LSKQFFGTNAKQQRCLKIAKLQKRRLENCKNDVLRLQKRCLKIGIVWSRCLLKKKIHRVMKNAYGSCTYADIQTQKRSTAGRS
jgi:hypothetical protein